MVNDQSQAGPDSGTACPVDVTSLHHRRAVRRWERTSVGDLLERLTWSVPDQDAIVGREGAYADERYRRLTYRTADELANRVAHGLLARGLSRGDVVMLFCENSVEAYVSKLAIAKAGLVCASVNPSMAQDMIASMVSLTEPAAAIVDAELWPAAQDVFSAAGVDVAVTIPFGGGAVAASVTFAEFESAQPSTEPDVEIHGDDIWEILFTSGTTAMPKGVLISHSSSYLCAYGFALSLTRGLRLEGDLRMGTGLPMIYHIGSQIFTFSTFLSGGTIVLCRRPDPDGLADMIAAERITAWWAGSPTMVAAVDKVLTARDDLDATSLGVLVYGWAALPPLLLASMKARCGDALTVFEIFGQTESISCHRFWPDRWPELYAATAPQDNYVGIPSPLLASTVFDPLGEDLAGTPGVAGEAVYRSPSMMAGYYRDPVATTEALRDGWFHSGDSCRYDDDGLRVMIDRYKDIVKTGGENVSSLRVESVLNQHPAVSKAVVIGLPHARWGEAVTAVVVLEDGVTVDPAELIAWSRERLAGYETPKGVVFVDTLPETIGGKVLKYKLRARHADTFTGAPASAGDEADRRTVGAS